ncbi:MAG: methylated-DNA--[protein]-cysteine S-methyltransferase [Hyphomicrobiales bacterium]
MIYYTIYKAHKMGDLLLIANHGGLIALNFMTGNIKIDISHEWKEDSNFMCEYTKQLDLYFKGKLKAFSLKLNLTGTEFQMKVWNELLKIKLGELMTYQDIANNIGLPNAQQAVGNAVGKNPIGIIVPCHRVVGSDNKLVGFAGGIKNKKQLLLLEGIYSLKTGNNLFNSI